VQEGAVLEGLVGQGLPAPAVVDGLVLAPVPNQNPLETTEGQFGQLRPTGDVHHRTLINHYPAGGVLPAADGLVDEVVDGEPAHVVGRQVSLGEDSNALALISQELDKLSCEVGLACARRPSDEHRLSSCYRLLGVYLSPGAGAHRALCLRDGKFPFAV
jgi:hypothetical protein